MDAVLGPGLGEGFELDGGGFAAECFVLVADGAHLVEVEEEVSVPAECFEVCVGEAPDRDVGDRGVVVVALGEFARVVGLGVGGLNDGVHEQAGGERVGLLLRDPLEGVAGAGGDLGGDLVEVAEGVADGGGGGVHDAGQWVHFDQGCVRFVAAPATAVSVTGSARRPLVMRARVSSSIAASMR